MKEFSETTRKKMSESAKRRCATPEWLESQRKRGTQLNVEEVKNMYESGMTQSEIAVELKVTQKVIFNFMRRNGIKARVAAKRCQEGSKNSYWHGGRTQDEFGYVMVQCKGHPRASKCGGYVPEHILVAERTIGRYLNPDEVVHHINGRKWDNDPDNLCVMTKSQHSKLHWLIKKYDPVAVTKLRFGEE